MTASLTLCHFDWWRSASLSLLFSPPPSLKISIVPESSHISSVLMTLQTKSPTRIFLPNWKLRFQNTGHGSMDTPVAPKRSCAPNQTYCHSCIPDSVSKRLPFCQSLRLQSSESSPMSSLTSHIESVTRPATAPTTMLLLKRVWLYLCICILLFKEITHSVGSKLRVYKTVQENISLSSASQPPTGNLYFFLCNSQRYCMYFLKKEIYLPLSPFFTQMVAHYT